MGWVIAGLLVLLLVGGLIGFARVRERDRQPADDTLLAELLGEDVPPPPPPPAPAPGDTVVLPPARTPDGTEILPVVSVPRAAEVPEAPAAARPPAPAGTPDQRAPDAPAEARAQPAPDAPDEDGDWLESQLSWIRNWSQRMQDQIGSSGAQEPDRHD
jgi:hypothetical protein